MRTIEGNLLDQSPGILCHQVNLRGVMGAGIALQIRQKWPQAHDDYIRRCRKAPRLGDIGLSRFGDGNGRVWVAHLFGQHFTPDLHCQTAYEVYPLLIKKVLALATVTQLPVYFPYGIGCGIAGGDWEVMERLLEEHIPEGILVKYIPREPDKIDRRRQIMTLPGAGKRAV